MAGFYLYKKLKKALIGLGIIGAAAALGVGIYYAAKGRGKAPKITTSIPTPKTAPSAPGTSKLTTPPVQTQTPPAPKPTPAPQPMLIQPSVPLQKQPLKYNIETLGNGRIKVAKADGSHTPVEMPEYLYHITSKSCMDKIKASDTLKISENEQLRGLYLLDSENFLSHYGKTTVNGKDKDLLTAIFNQANRGNKSAPSSNQELVVIKIPTKDLLQNGKLRIRTQEDFFTFTEKLKEIEKKTGKKFTLRGLQQDAKRTEFEKLVLSNGLMEKSEFEKFMRDMKIKIHYGYSISGAAAHNLENTNSIEYIFNHDIKLSDFPNIKVQTIHPKNYVKKGTGTVEADKARAIFEGTFMPITS